MCETYSRDLFVPVGADVSTLIGSVKFRVKGRLPVLSYYYRPKHVCSKGRLIEGGLIETLFEALGVLSWEGKYFL